MARPPFSSQLIADVGISMGDEGKGRLIPEVVEDLQQQTGDAEPVSVVLKVNGGANSGHTVCGLKLNLYPGGAPVESVKVLGIGGGVVADPLKFRWEGAYIEKHGFDVRHRLLIDERTMLSDVSHRLLDLAGEFYRAEILGAEKRGSTGRGISPSYVDETSHFLISYNAFLGEKEHFASQLRTKLDRACRQIQHVYQVTPEVWDEFFEILTTAEQRANAETIEAGLFTADDFDFGRFKGKLPFTLDVDRIIEEYWEAGTALKDNIGDLRERILDTLAAGKFVVGEFGQSYWLDKRFSVTRSPTASHTYTPEFFLSANIPVQPIHTLGVCKAYDTKVGNHIFISEMPDAHPLTKVLKKLEYGTSTGRQRMVGWYDAVEKGDALRFGGFQEMMINKLDALSYTGDWQGGELLICTSYRDDKGNLYHHVPRDRSLQGRLNPVYIQLPGWEEDIRGVRSWADLPANAQRYVAMMVKTTFDVAYEGHGYPPELPNLRYIGVGPDTSQIIRDVPETSDLLKLCG